MKEKIIILNKRNELLAALAYRGLGSINTRVLSSLELAQHALLRQGMLMEKEVIGNDEQIIYLANAIKDIPYFNKVKAKDIGKLLSSINSLRQLITSDNEEEVFACNIQKGSFALKNEAILQAYRNYLSLLKSNDRIDMIMALRQAIARVKKSDLEITIIKEMPLTALEYELAAHLGEIKEESIFDLFDTKKTSLQIADYRNYYGNKNEAEGILSKIIAKGKPLDENVVALADPSENQLFYDLAMHLKIKMSFGMGIPIANSYPANLLKLYSSWSNEGSFGSKPLLQMLSSVYFNQEIFKSKLRSFSNGKEEALFYQTLGNLRLTNDEQINNERLANYEKAIRNSASYQDGSAQLLGFIDNLKTVSSILCLGVEGFIEEYGIIRNDNETVRNLDISAKKTIAKEIRMYQKMGLAATKETIEYILKKNICQGTSKPGYLYITSIENALTALKQELYIAGLAAASYPGAPKEDPLVLDEDYENFNGEDLTSTARIRKKWEQLHNLVELANCLGNSIYLSYPGINVSEIKINNASSMLFDIYKEEFGTNKSLDDMTRHIREEGYFEPHLFKTAGIGEAYNDDLEIKPERKTVNNKQLNIRKNYFSPSALGNFFSCPMSFLFNNIMSIPQPDDYLPYEVLGANEMGTLVHSMMEYLGKHQDLSLEAFLELGRKAFDDFTEVKVPLIEDDIQKNRDDFLEMLANGYRMDKSHEYELALAEEDVKVEHESGLVIHGFPDRVEKINGQYVVVDFKTGNRETHIDDDVDSCLQALLYALILEKKYGYQISHVEYRYLRTDTIIKCRYDSEIKKQVDERLFMVKKAIDGGNLKPVVMTEDDEKQLCRYCKYGPICGKEVSNDY